jgi:hypothetical protein
VFGKANGSVVNLSAIASASNPLGGFVIHLDQWHYYRLYQTQHKIYLHLDVNGDGLDDLIVGAYFADPSHKSSAGKSYVVFGKANSGAINLSAITPCWVVCISNHT